DSYRTAFDYILSNAQRGQPWLTDWNENRIQSVCHITAAPASCRIWGLIIAINPDDLIISLNRSYVTVLRTGYIYEKNHGNDFMDPGSVGLLSLEPAELKCPFLITPLLQNPTQHPASIMPQNSS